MLLEEHPCKQSTLGSSTEKHRGCSVVSLCPASKLQKEWQYKQSAAKKLSEILLKIYKKQNHHTQDGATGTEKRNSYSMIWDAVQSKEMREDNESRKKATKRYPASHGLVETLGFCSVLEIHDAPDARTGKSVKRNRDVDRSWEKPCLSLPWY